MGKFLKTERHVFDNPNLGAGGSSVSSVPSSEEEGEESAVTDSPQFPPLPPLLGSLGRGLVDNLQDSPDLFGMGEVSEGEVGEPSPASYLPSSPTPPLIYRSTSTSPSFGGPASPPLSTLPRTVTTSCSLCNICLFCFTSYCCSLVPHYLHILNQHNSISHGCINSQYFNNNPCRIRLICLIRYVCSYVQSY